MKYTKDFAEEIVQKILSGEMRAYQASKEYVVPAATICQWIKRKKIYGDFRTVRGVVPKYSIEEFCAIIEKNKSLKILEIAELIGENRFFVSYNLKRCHYRWIDEQWTRV